MLRDGFTLLELVISFGVMSIVIFGAASLYVTSIRANAAQVERFIAYNLAQEGLEGVRNIRDSYYREGLAWDGSDRSHSLVDAPFDRGFYRIYRKPSFSSTSFSSTNLNDPNQLKNASPWVFTSCPEADKACDQLYTTKDGTSYVHQIDGVKSPYSRKITISFPDENGKPSTTIMRVTSTVTWLDHGSAKSLDLVTELTDWKQRSF